MNKEELNAAVKELVARSLDSPTGGEALAFAQAAGHVASLVYTIDLQGVNRSES